MQEIHLSIDELIVEGANELDGQSIAQAIADELEGLLYAQPPAPKPPLSSVNTISSESWTAGDSLDTLGSIVAQAVFEVLVW